VNGSLAWGSPDALAFTQRGLNHWLRAAWPAFSHSLSLQFMGFSTRDARAGVLAATEKRDPEFGAGCSDEAQRS
jgi:enoyl-CoA hydratase